MKRRGIIFLLLGLLAAAVLPAQQNAPIITVMDFGGSGLAQNELMVFTDYLASHIVQTRRFTVIDRMQRQLMLQEIEFSKSDCTDETCQLEIGRMLSANQIVVGSLGKFGDRFICNIKLIEVETARTANTASKTYASLNDLLEDSQNLILSLLRMEAPAAAAAPAAQPASAPSAAAPAPEAVPKKKGSIPVKTIRIDGRYEDWDGVDPILLDLAGDRVGILKGTDIGAVYLAVDDKYYYVRFLVCDGEFPLGYSEYFQAQLSIGLTSQTILNLSSICNRGWKAQVELRDRTYSRTTVLGSGGMRHGGQGFEARFPIELIAGRLEQSKPYSVTGIIGYNNASQFVTADRTPTATLTF